MRKGEKKGKGMTNFEYEKMSNTLFLIKVLTDINQWECFKCGQRFTKKKNFRKETQSRRYLCSLDGRNSDYGNFKSIMTTTD